MCWKSNNVATPSERPSTRKVCFHPQVSLLTESNKRLHSSASRESNSFNSTNLLQTSFMCFAVATQCVFVAIYSGDATP